MVEQPQRTGRLVDVEDSIMLGDLARDINPGRFADGIPVSQESTKRHGEVFPLRLILQASHFSDVAPPNRYSKV